MVDLVLNEEQRQIRESVRTFLEDRAPIARLHGGKGDLDLWPEIGALGWFALGLTEEQGGLGLGMAEEMIVAVECGRSLLSPAFVGSVIGAHMAAGAQVPALMDAIVTGNTPVGIGIARDCPAEADGARSVLLVDVQHGQPFCIWQPGAIALYPWTALDDVRIVPALDEATELASAVLDVRASLASTHEVALPARADVLIAAMLNGLADAAIAPTTAYAIAREQFGRPIGGFQAIKHRCADMAVRGAAAASQTLYAAVTHDGGLLSMGREASMARLIASDAAIGNAAAMVQIHGGMGYTNECEAHLLVKRAQLLSRIGGDTRVHERRVLEPDLT